MRLAEYSPRSGSRFRMERPKPCWPITAPRLTGVTDGFESPRRWWIAPSRLRHRPSNSSTLWARGRTISRAPQVHYTPASSAIQILDRDTGEARAPVTADYLTYAKVVAGLPGIQAQSTAFIPSDVDQRIADAYRLFLSLLVCEKPVVTGAFSVEGFALMRDLLLAVRGIEQALARKTPGDLHLLSDLAVEVDPRWRGQSHGLCAGGDSRRDHSGAAVGFHGAGDHGRDIDPAHRRSAQRRCPRPVGAPGYAHALRRLPRGLRYPLRVRAHGSGRVHDDRLRRGRDRSAPRPADPGLYRAQRRQGPGCPGRDSNPPWAPTLAALSCFDNVSGPGMLDFINCHSTDQTGRGSRDLRHGGPAPAGDGTTGRLPFVASCSASFSPRVTCSSPTTPAAISGRKSTSRARSSIAPAGPAGSRRDHRPSGDRAAAEVDRLVAEYTPSRLSENAQCELIDRMTVAARRCGMDVLPDRDV